MAFDELHIFGKKKRCEDLPSTSIDLGSFHTTFQEMQKSLFSAGDSITKTCTREGHVTQWLNLGSHGHRHSI
jgi:hypothetical protein